MTPTGSKKPPKPKHGFGVTHLCEIPPAARPSKGSPHGGRLASRRRGPALSIMPPDGPANLGNDLSAAQRGARRMRRLFATPLGWEPMKMFLTGPRSADSRGRDPCLGGPPPAPRPTRRPPAARQRVKSRPGCRRVGRGALPRPQKHLAGISHAMGGEPKLQTDATAPSSSPGSPWGPILSSEARWAGGGGGRGRDDLVHGKKNILFSSVFGFLGRANKLRFFVSSFLVNGLFFWCRNASAFGQRKTQRRFHGPPNPAIGLRHGPNCQQGKCRFCSG